MMRRGPRPWAKRRPWGWRELPNREATMTTRLVLSASVRLMTLAPLAGCRHEGPAEQAGKGIDNSIRDMKGTLKTGSALVTNPVLLRIRHLLEGLERFVIHP